MRNTAPKPTLLNVLVLFLLLVATVFPGAVQAASVGAAGYTNGFNGPLPPPAADWSTLSIGSGAGNVITPAGLDLAVQAVAASSITTQPGADAADPPALLGIAVWSSSGQYLQTRSTGNDATLLLCTLVNNLGGDAIGATISYDYAKVAVAAEEIEGHRAYYSLTGVAGSWTVIPSFSSAVPGRLTASLTLAWPNGGNLYLLWADDNGSPSPDTGNQIDNFSVTATPGTQTAVAITTSPQSQAVAELQPVSFTVGASGYPSPTYQWYKNNAAITDATNSTYAIAAAPLSDSGALFKVVAANTASNVNYSATSGVATLTVNADTVAPTLVRTIGVPAGTVSVDFSEAIRADTANVAANYAVTSAVGNLTISSAVLQANGSNVVLTTSALTLGTTYTLLVNNIRDVSAASNQIAPNSTRTFTALSLVLTDIGSPVPAGSATPSGNGYNITAGGADIGGTNDQFTFNNETLLGDFDVKVRLAGLTLSDAWAKAGLMARESLANNARYAASLATPSVSGCFFQYRSTAGAGSTNAGSFPATYPNAWLRLKRATNLFSGFASLDGSTWSSLGSVTIAGMPSQLVVGMCISSRANGTTTTAQFRDFVDVVGNPPAVSVTLPMEPLGPSARRSPLAISEIMYHPRTVGINTNRSLEFIEVFNSQAFDERIGGYRISGSVDYTFASNTVIKSGGFLVVARDPAFVQSHYGISGVLGPWSGLMTNVTEGFVISSNSLPGSAGTVRLRNRQGAVLLEVNYVGGNPWPIAADGSGHSLVLNHATYGEGDPRAWSASDSIDGSPGRAEPFSADPLRNVVINEFLAHTVLPLEDYIELYNHGSQAIDISGAILTDEADTNKFRVPNGTILPAGGFASFNESTLGFGLSATGERIILINSNANRVIDAVAFDTQANGRSTGRVPDGSPYFYPLAARTPGAANGAPWRSPIVINEIMHTPISGNSDDEYVELYNRSAISVNLGNWKFNAGIAYTFPSNVVLAPGGYLVVAKNITNLFAHYPGVLNGANTLGNYQNKLGNSDSLALAFPDRHVTTNALGQFVTNTIHPLANDIAYGKGGRWGTWAAGGGSSMELVDPNADTRLAANWADSDEMAKSANLWTSVEFTGTLGESLGTPINDRLLIFLLGIGECLVDEVELHNGAGPNLVLNGGFESGLTSWVLQGSHDFSTIENTGFAGNKCLHLRAGSRGDNGENRIRTDGATFTASGTVSIRAKVRWLRGWPEICLRIRGGTAEAIGRMQLPLNLGTPGQRNSRALPNAGPAIYDVAHSPVLPQGGETVVVTAKASDPDGIGSLALKFRVDAGNLAVTPALFGSVAMLDNGAGGDAIAGDGIFSGTIPAQAAGKTVAFYVQATDTSGATNLFPQDVFPQPGFDRLFPNDAPTHECVIRWGDFVMPGNFATYHLWLTFATSNRWAFRGRPTTSDGGLNNAELDGTFVYNNYRVVYNAKPLYAGSPWHRGAMTTGPCGGNRVDFVMNFPADNRMLGVTDFVFNNPGNPGGTSTSDSSAQTEQTSYIMFNEIGLVYNYRRYIHYFVNGSQRSTTSDRAGNFIFEDSQQPNADMINEWFPDDTGGDLYKIEDWFEFPDNGYDFSANNDADLTRRSVLVNGQQTMVITPYRFMFRKRSVGPGDNTADYTSFFNLVNAVSPAASPTSATVDPAAVDTIADYDQWMRIFAVQHAIGNWDSYGYERGKNDYTYKPARGKFQQMTWDIDFTMGVGGHGTGQTIFDVSDPRVNAMWSTPVIMRSFWRGFLDIVNGPMQNSFIDPILDAKHAALLANNINVNASIIGTIKSFVTGRRAYLVTQLASATPGFSVSTAASFSTAANVVTITGGASVAIKDISINGVFYPVTWAGTQAAPTNWTIRVPLVAGANSLVIQGLDENGNPVAGSSRTLAVTYTGGVPAPEGNVVFNEILYNPLVPDASYVELFNRSSSFGFDLSGWRINGLDFTFPGGSVIATNQYLVVAKNRSMVGSTYGFYTPYGFDGNLDPDGETLSLIKPSLATNMPDILIDKVRYEAVLPWPVGTNGIPTASSIALLDASQDNSRSANWSTRYVPAVYSPAISFPGATNSGWVHVIYTNVISTTGTNLLIFLNGASDIYFDDIVLVTGIVPEAGPNILQNGDFESPLTGPWTTSGNHINSVISTARSHSGANSLHIISTGAGSASANISQLFPAFASSQVCALSYWYYAVETNISMTLRAVGGSSFINTTNVQVVVIPASYTPPQLITPAVLSLTPGARNSGATNLTAFAPIWLNEVQPNNVSGPTDSFGQHGAWVELYNAGTNTVSLDGYYLADNYTSNLTQWPFPVGATIGSNEFKLIWLDSTPGHTSASEWHANFTPGLASGQIAMVRILNATPQIVDYLTYSKVGPSLSYGDFPDGQPFSRFILQTPTPLSANTSGHIDVFVNEWMAINGGILIDPTDDQSDDWFELYNAGGTAVDLGNYYLTDNTNQPAKFRIPNNAHYIIPPGGYLLVWADNDSNANSTNQADLHVSFQLSGIGEQIGLYAQDGLTPIDTITFAAQSTNISEGRFPDGTANRYLMANPTPRAANVISSGNTAPVLDSIADRTVRLGQIVSFTATAHDADLPPQFLTFALGDTPPAGASINSAGLFTWMPSPAQTPSTNHITVVVTDNGPGLLSGFGTFTITVRPPPVAMITGGGGTSVHVTFDTTPGRSYRLDYKLHIDDPGWVPLPVPPVLATGTSLTIDDDITGLPQRFYRVFQVD